MGGILASVPVTQAAFFQNSFGLSGPHRTITFNEHVFPDGAFITQEYMDLGVSFSPHAHYFPVSALTADAVPNLEGYCATSYVPFGGLEMEAQIIQLSQPQTEIAFTFTTYDETLATFQALLDGVEIESATTPVDNRQNNVYGFRTTKKFNAIRISTNQWPAWDIDNIQLSVTGPLIGETLKTSANYNFSLEQGTQKTESIQLVNSATAAQTATLEIFNPHPNLITVTLAQSNPTIAAGETLTLPINLEPIRKFLFICK